MLFTGSVVVACSVGSLVWLLVVFVWLRFMIWGPGAAIGPVRAFSLVRCLLFSFVYFVFAGLGSCAVSWSYFFIYILLLFFGRFVVFSPCTHEWTCGCVIFHVW
jgi:hypothetical protein